MLAFYVQRHLEASHNTSAVAVNGRGIVMGCLWETDKAVAVTIRYMLIFAIIMLL